MCTLRIVAVEVLLHDQLSILVEKDAVYILVSAIEDCAHNRLCCRDSEGRARNVSNGDTVMHICRRIVPIIRGRVLPFGPRPGQCGGFWCDGAAKFADGTFRFVRSRSRPH